jgi:uncharacterized protein (DUF983 family)
MLGRAALRRCPLCRWLRPLPRCRTCGFDWERKTDGFMTGSMTISIIVTFGVILTTIVGVTIATYPELPVRPLVAALLVVSVCLPVVIHPMTCTAWLAVDLAMRPPSATELADADVHALPGARHVRHGRVAGDA